MTHSRLRRGVTLFQLLVVIAILALLLALLLPATVQIRMAAARQQSQNNIKQLALALHNYESAYAAFPPGANKEGYSTHALILPFIEQENVFRLIDFKKPPTDKANAEIRKTRIKVFVSPLDNVMAMTETGPTNYLFCAGSMPALANNDGILFAESKMRIADITDGTSNTILAGETLRGDGGVKATTVARQHVALKADALKGIKPEAGVADWKDDKNIAADRGAAWMDGKFLQALFTATRAMNDEKPDVDCGGVGGMSGLRTAINGTNVGLCDGSVRFFSTETKFKTWQALATRNGGEVVMPD